MPETTSIARKPIASLRKRLILGMVSLLAATAIWLPCLHFVYWPPLPPPKEESEVEPLAITAGRPATLFVDGCRVPPAGTGEDARKQRRVGLHGPQLPGLGLGQSKSPPPGAEGRMPGGDGPHHRRNAQDRAGARHVPLSHALCPESPFRDAAAAQPVPRRRDGHDAGLAAAGCGKGSLPGAASPPRRGDRAADGGGAGPVPRATPTSAGCSATARPWPPSA